MGISTELPERLGRYRVLGLLARGGMAEILLGRLEGPSGFRRPVVLKRILSHFADSRRFIDALRDEARISAAISHANVVSVHELCEENGEIFVVMEHLNGVSVRELMSRAAAREALTPHLAAWIVAEGCAGLHAAHTATDGRGLLLGVVHRDISLDNLFVTVDGDVKVLDFGIASAARRASFTLPGEVKGKASYMAPEQIRGEPTSARADLFAMGVVLFEISTGQRLFRGASADPIRRGIGEGQLPRPSELVAGYPTALDEVCARALRIDAAERFESAAEMRAALLGAVSTRAAGGSPRDELGAIVREAFAEQLQRQRERWTAVMTPAHDPSSDPAPDSMEERATLQFRPAQPPRLFAEISGAPVGADVPAPTAERDTAPSTPVALRGDAPPPRRQPLRQLLFGAAVGAVVALTAWSVTHRGRPPAPVVRVDAPAPPVIPPAPGQVAAAATTPASPHGLAAPEPPPIEPATLEPPMAPRPPAKRRRHLDPDPKKAVSRPATEYGDGVAFPSFE